MYREVLTERGGCTQHQSRAGPEVSGLVLNLKLVRPARPFFPLTL